MKKRALPPLAAACALFVLHPAVAQDGKAPAPDAAGAAEVARLNAVLQRQQPRFGDVALPAAHAVLHLGKNYYFLGPEDSREVLKEWGNPPSAADGVLGMVFPAGRTFVDDTWGAVLTQEDVGHVKDDDADSADYDTIIKRAQKAEEAENEQRRKEGFEPLHLVGWAQPPTYNHDRHYIIWARDIQFGDKPVHDLNYDVRMLGRTGLLSVNLVTKMDRLAETRVDAEKLAASADFAPGQRYADFDKTTDKVASVGVGGLVAAGLGLVAAKKIGLLAGLLLFAKKGVAILAAAAAGATAWFKKLFKRQPPPTPPTVG